MDNLKPTPSVPSASHVQRPRRIHFVIVLAWVVLFWLLGLWMSAEPPKKQPQILTSSALTPLSLGGEHVDNGAIWLHRAENKVTHLQKDIEALKGQWEKFQQDKPIQAVAQKHRDDNILALQQKLEAFQKQFEAQKEALSAFLPSTATDSEGQPLTRLPVNATKKISTADLATAVPTFRQAIHQEEFALTPTSTSQNASASDKTPEQYVPAGTFAKAVLLSGLDAAAGVTSQAQPRPVILRLTEEGTLPNHLHSHLKDCLVTGAGYGDISSERVYIRLERMSCAQKNQTLLEIPVYGYVSGPDGKAGIRGVPVWRENALLQRSFVSGLFSGLGQGISLPSSLHTPENAYGGLDSGNVLRMGMVGGASTALGKLADYNIRRAEQYQPIIEVGATSVNVIFHTGFFFDAAPHPDMNATASSSPPASATAMPL